MSAAHTPGPWAAGPDGTVSAEAASGATFVVAVAMGGAEVTPRRRAANARLIAACPQLLAYAQCEEARTRGEDIAETVLRRHGFDPRKGTAEDFMDHMRRAAIAKVSGGAR